MENDLSKGLDFFITDLGLWPCLLTIKLSNFQKKSEGTLNNILFRLLYLPSISIGTDSIGAKIANVKRQNKFIIFSLCIMISALGLFKFKAVHHMFWRKTNSEFLLSKAVERLHTRLDITMQPLIQHIFTKIIDFYLFLFENMLQK